MSEYQYYEFRAIDRPLSKAEMDELRAISTRAKITPSSFQNVYNFGDFRGDPRALMERYFDAFVYVANWGTQQLMLRLPRRFLNPDSASLYAVDECLDVTAGDDFVLLSFTSQDEDGVGWVDDEQAQGWLPSLLPLRAELANGDLRALYLGWLAAAAVGWLAADDDDDDDDEEIHLPEPPVPPGLDSLSPALKTLVEFLRIDEDLLAVAAEASAALPAPPSRADRATWLRTLPGSDKDAWLLRLIEGDDARLRTEILQRFRLDVNPPLDLDASGRLAGELLSKAAARTEARLRQETERRAATEASQRQKQQEARAKHLDRLRGQEEALWRQAEALIDTVQPRAYDQAVQLLVDLRDLSARQQQAGDFAARLDSLRWRNARRPSFLQRLDSAQL